MADYKTINYPVTPLYLDQQTMAKSLSVTIASDQTPIPITGTVAVTTSNASVGLNGAAIPTSSTLIGGSDGTDLLPLTVTTVGPITALDVNIAAGAITATNPSVGVINSTAPLSATFLGGKNQLGNLLGISAKTLGTQLTTSDVGVVTNTIIHGLTTGGGGGYVDIKCTPSGALITNTTVTGNVNIVVTNSKGEFVRNDYTVNNVDTITYYELIAATAQAYNAIEIFDSSGQTLVFAIGAAASEIDQFIIFPGGNGRIPFTLASGERVSIKALSATANAGEIDINFYV